MKMRLILLLGVVIVILHGCFVKSLHPFFKKENVVFNPKLLGVWLDQDSGQWVISQHKHSLGFMSGDTVDASYEIVYREKPGITTTFHAHLFKLGGNDYVDFYVIDESGNDMYEIHMIPAHTLAKIKVGERLEIKWFNEEWLKKLFEENRIRISHEKLKLYGDEEDSYILTASTEELQKFLLKYGNDENAFKRNWEAYEEDREKDAFVYTLTRQK